MQSKQQNIAKLFFYFHVWPNLNSYVFPTPATEKSCPATSHAIAFQFAVVPYLHWTDIAKSSTPGALD